AGGDAERVRAARGGGIQPPGDRGSDGTGGRNLQGAAAPGAPTAQGEAAVMDDLTLEHPDLEELFDAGGPLPPRVREHVAGCRQCTVELATLAELRRAARALPESVAPGRDLWTGIAERIER